MVSTSEYCRRKMRGYEVGYGVLLLVQSNMNAKADVVNHRLAPGLARKTYFVHGHLQSHT